jgi:hypothetical protein
MKERTEIKIIQQKHFNCSPVCCVGVVGEKKSIKVIFFFRVQIKIKMRFRSEELIGIRLIVLI